MSVIGPRPGLWNQDILTAERDKYNANDVKPGLTGWAQINGRDELEIPDKAKLDRKYFMASNLKWLRVINHNFKSIIKISDGISVIGVESLAKAMLRRLGH